MNLCKAISLLYSYNVPEHIIIHSYKVTKVAWIISSELFEHDVSVDKELVLYASLLHDITKYDSILNKDEDHSVTGGIFLRNLGFENIADIVENHIILKEQGDFILEKKIVYYSDKRVMHDKVVPLKIRYDDLLVRYSKSIYSESMIIKGFERAKNIEDEIFQELDFSPEYLNFLL